MSTALLEAKHISYRAGERVILQDISLTLERGQILTLIGPNGAGKTTLLRILLGQLEASAGSVLRAPNLQMGYMPQRLQLNRSLPIRVGDFLALSGAKQPDIISQATSLNIAHLLMSSMHKISGGETQRVLLTRALLRNPDLLVLDEPAQGVDIAGQSELYALLGTLRDQRHLGILIVSHDLHLVMATTDTVLCLNQHICCHGHPEHVSSHPAYLALFGKAAPQHIAVYTHHHDHVHTLDGNATGCSHD